VRIEVETFCRKQSVDCTGRVVLGGMKSVVAGGLGGGRFVADVEVEAEVIQQYSA
jgi:hypothetical protein